MKLGEPAVSLEDPKDFPLLYRSANTVSLSGQNRFLCATKTRLGGLLVAAVGGVLGWSYWGVNVGGVVALVAFIVALAAELYGALVRPERAWYKGRAAAESVKTLTWRYVVRGESFEEDDGTAVDQKFLAELAETLHDLGDIDLAVEADEVGSQITEKMRCARSLPFEARRLLYLDGRIREQQRWYSSHADWNAKRAHQWLIAGIVIEFLGVIVAAVRAFGSMDIDLLGIAAAAAATAATWVQAKQYQNLATAYSITAQELSAVGSEAEALTDEECWARFVGEAEEAISREHTLWRASRGLRIRPHRPGS